MGNTGNKLSLLILECSKTPIEINGSSGYIKKITFKTYLHLCSSFSIWSSLAYLLVLICMVASVLVFFLFGLEVVAKQNTKQSSMC